MARRYRRKNGQVRKHSAGLMTTAGLATAGANLLVGGTYNIPYELGEVIQGRQPLGEALGKVAVAVKEGAPGLVAGVGSPLVVRGLMQMFGIKNPTVISTKKWNIRLV